MESIVCCTECGYRSITYSEFLSLSVPIIGQGGQKFINVANCLEKFTEKEVIPWKCDECVKSKKNQSYGIKQLTVTRYPKILCLHLNRLVQMSGTQRKIDIFIEFNKELNLFPYTTAFKGNFSGQSTEEYLDTSPRLVGFTDPKKAINYSLVAIIVHLGDAHGGHYVVYKRLLELEDKDTTLNLTKDWVMISDSHWELVPESHVLKQKAYLLFYEKS